MFFFFWALPLLVMSNPINHTLGALRIAAKRARLSCKNSADFRQAAKSLITLRDSVNNRAVLADHVGEVQKRTDAFERSTRLQHSLEVHHKLPHRRKLMTAVHLADSSGRFDGESIQQMRQVVAAGNAARHRKWSGQPSTKCKDPWFVGDGDPWSTLADPAVAAAVSTKTTVFSEACEVNTDDVWAAWTPSTFKFDACTVAFVSLRAEAAVFVPSVSQLSAVPTFSQSFYSCFESLDLLDFCAGSVCQWQCGTFLYDR